MWGSAKCQYECHLPPPKVLSHCRRIQAVEHVCLTENVLKEHHMTFETEMKYFTCISTAKET